MRCRKEGERPWRMRSERLSRRLLVESTEGDCGCMLAGTCYSSKKWLIFMVYSIVKDLMDAS